MDNRSKADFIVQSTRGDFTPPIAGMSYDREFLDSSASESILDAVDRNSWDCSLTRRVQQYGYRYNYRTSRVEADDYLGAFPDWLQAAVADIEPFFDDEETVQQVIINEYLPGQGIASHVDQVRCFGKTIAMLSLGSLLVMDFLEPNTAQRHSITLEPGSLLVLEGDARFKWKHGIASRQSDRIAGRKISRGRRVSLTFRSIIEGHLRH